MSKIRLIVIILGIFVVVAQFAEFWANDVLSNSEKKKEAVYTDYERYIDFQIQALVIRGSYNTLQAVNNSSMHEVMVEREKEVLDRLLQSLLALTVHIEEDYDKNEWFTMNYTELMNLTLELSPIINAEYDNSKNEVNAWKQYVNIISAIKFSLLAFEVIFVNFDKNKKR